MTLKKKFTLILLLTTVNTILHAKKDINIKDYVDRSIHYYPKYLHLKESEFRLNNRHNDIYVILLNNLRENNL